MGGAAEGASTVFAAPRPLGKGAKIKLEDKDSDVLFKEVPIETYPGLAIQSVTDSSRWSRVTCHEGLCDDWIIFADISS